MKKILSHTIMIGFALLLGSQANAQQTATKGGQLTESEIQENRIYRRAVEAAIWSPTKPGVDYFLLFRLYGVEKELYEGNWILGNLVKQK